MNPNPYTILDVMLEYFRQLSVKAPYASLVGVDRNRPSKSGTDVRDDVSELIPPHEKKWFRENYQPLLDKLFKDGYIEMVPWQEGSSSTNYTITTDGFIFSLDKGYRGEIFRRHIVEDRVNQVADDNLKAQKRMVI